MQKVNIAVFASGRGSNALAIIKHSEQANYRVSLIVTNQKNAGVIDLAKKHQINALILDREYLYDTQYLRSVLQRKNIRFIALAGFLWLIPSYLIRAYSQRMLNIHPALLPKYGGKGMYGMLVHEAVFKAKETVSGITVHYVNELYDEGKIIFQQEVSIRDCKSPEAIAKRVLEQEHKWYPRVIQREIDLLLK